MRWSTLTVRSADGTELGTVHRDGYPEARWRYGAQCVKCPGQLYAHTLGHALAYLTEPGHDCTPVAP